MSILSILSILLMIMCILQPTLPLSASLFLTASSLFAPPSCQLLAAVLDPTLTPCPLQFSLDCTQPVPRVQQPTLP